MRLIYAAALIGASVMAVSGAANPFLGTWKLDTGKSHFAPGEEKQNMIVTFEMNGDSVKRIATGTDGQGKPIMQGDPRGVDTPWDGKEHPVNDPSAPGMSLMIKTVGSNTVEVIQKVQGKVVRQVHSVVSNDGKTMMNTETSADQGGHKTQTVEVFEKQ